MEGNLGGNKLKSQLERVGLVLGGAGGSLGRGPRGLKGQLGLRGWNLKNRSGCVWQVRARPSCTDAVCVCSGAG